MGQFIDHHRRWGLARICQHIKQKYPCAFVVFLVTQGLHDDVAENGFWPDVDQAIGQELGANWHRQFGQLFEEILVDNHLPLFPDMGGYRYVSLILVHGGIPTPPTIVGIRSLFTNKFSLSIVPSSCPRPLAPRDGLSNGTPTPIKLN